MPPGLRSMSPTGGFHSLSMAPVTTKNRFEALAVRVVLDSEGAQIFRDGIVSLSSLVKTKNPNKKRRGKAALSGTSTSSSGSSGKYISAPCQNEKSENYKRLSSTALSTSPSTPSSCLQTARRPCYSGQGFQHPGHGQPLKPRAGSRFCSHFHIDCCSHLHNSSVDFIDNADFIDSTQQVFDDFLRNSQRDIGGVDEVFKAGVGVGGIELGSVGEIGVGGMGSHSSGGIMVGLPAGSTTTSGMASGGKGAESHEENGGKGWTFVAGSRKGGIGSDSSVGESGMKEIGTGVGGDVRRKERISVGTEDKSCALQGSFCGGLQGRVFCGFKKDRK